MGVSRRTGTRRRTRNISQPYTIPPHLYHSIHAQRHRQTMPGTGDCTRFGRQDALTTHLHSDATKGQRTPMVRTTPASDEHNCRQRPRLMPEPTLDRTIHDQAPHTPSLPTDARQSNQSLAAETNVMVRMARHTNHPQAHASPRSKRHRAAARRRPHATAFAPGCSCITKGTPNIRATSYGAAPSLLASGDCAH